MADPMSSAFDQSQSPVDQALGSGMDPRERDLMIRTLYGEAGGEGPRGQAAVAHVIRNRLNSGNFGDSLSSVITAPKQFSMWNAGDPAGATARKLSADDPRYQAIGNIVDGVMGGKIADPTGGADHYYNPHVADPDWGDKLAKRNDVMIGNHRFVGGPIGGTNGQADVPSPGASPAMGQQSPAMMQAMQQGDEEPQGLLQKFASGGISGLLGLKSNQQNARPFDLGNAMTKAGIAAMARDNPSGASAMAQVPAMEARAWQPRFQNVNYNPTTGQQITLDARTGQAGARQVPGAQPFVQMPAEASKRFDDNNTYINQMSTVNLPELRKIQQQLVSGEIDPSMLKQGMQKLQLMANSGDEKARALVNAQHWIGLVHQDFLKHQEGTQTDKDAEHAYEAIMPGNSEYDSGAMANAIDNVVKSERAHMASAAQYQRGALNTYKNQLPFDPHETLGNYANYNKSLDESDSAWAKVRDPWMQSRNASSAAGSKPTAPSPKYSGSHSQSGGEGSIPTMSPEAAQKLPSGSTFRGADGQIYKVR